MRPAGANCQERAAVKKILPVLLCVFIQGCGSPSTPSEAFKTTLLKANQGKYSEIDDSLSDEGRKFAQALGDRSMMWDVLTRKGTIKNVEVLKEEIRGEGATLRFRLTFKDGGTAEGEERFVKEKGVWKSSFQGILMARDPKEYKMPAGD
jgi:hypothetical protein